MGLFLLFAFLLFQTIHAQNACPPQSCGTNPLPIRFPFTLLQDQQQKPQTCGYPNFSLTCSSNLPTLTLPYSGDQFAVQRINYRTQEIDLSDPDNCLPAKLLTLNLKSSPFAAAYIQNITLLTCPREYVYGLAALDCLGNATVRVVATLSASLVREMTMCSSSVHALPVTENSYELSDELSDYLRLTWSFPDCQGCEAQGGVCGYDRNSTSGQIVCYFDRKKGEARGLHIFKIIALSIVIPAILCSITISVFTFIAERRAARIRAAAVAATPPPPPTNTMAGLDDSTIESYKKVVVGESKRLPGPNGATCPICLVDYNPKDTVRCIPECQHCFHSDCVDEWLRLSSSCPVCRKSPLHDSATR